MTVADTDAEKCGSIMVVLTSAFQIFSSMEHFSRVKYFTERHPLFLSWQYSRLKKGVGGDLMCIFVNLFVCL